MPYDLYRFIEAQNAAQRFETALEELRSGQKRSHWIWFIFPQIAGLGYSDIAQFYAIENLEEALAYINHPVLGPRLHQAANALLQSNQTDPIAVLGGIDAMKVRSSMTLFLKAAPNDQIFQKVLDTFYGGQMDQNTLQILDNQ